MPLDFLIAGMDSEKLAKIETEIQTQIAIDARVKKTNSAEEAFGCYLLNDYVAMALLDDFPDEGFNAEKLVVLAGKIKRKLSDLIKFEAPCSNIYVIVKDYTRCQYINSYGGHRLLIKADKKQSPEELASSTVKDVVGRLLSDLYPSNHSTISKDIHSP